MASILTGTVTVNAAFFQEIKEVDQDLWRLLSEVRQICGEPSRLARDRRSFLDVVATLRDQLALHFALEEAYGYFDDPIHVAPRLCDRASALRDEHKQLYLWYCELELRAIDVLEHGSPARPALTALVREMADFDEQLRRHEQEENQLIQQEYSDDIGVGD